MSVQRRNKVIIDLQITYSGYKVIEPDTMSNRRTRISNSRPEFVPQRKNWPSDIPRIGFDDPLKQVPPPNLPAAHLTLPVSTGWFDINEVHQIQRKALPQFFTNPNPSVGPFKKSEKLYRYYRNTIIGMWRQNTKKYLPASACRRNLLGDVCSIVRVHAFLENWGIINFPSKEIKGPIVKRQTKTTCHVCSNSHYKFYVYQDQEIQFWVCVKCFDSGLYPKFMQQESFRAVDISKPNQNQWTATDTLKLLEAIQQNKDKENWNEVFREFPGKSKQEVIMQFLRCPSLRLSKSASIFDNGQDIKSSPAPLFPPNLFGDYKNPLQIAIAVLMKVHSQNPTAQTTELLDTLKIHTQYLQKREQSKLDKQMKLLTDLSMNKIECKVVYLHEYSLLVEAMRRHTDQLATNNIAQILKQAMRE